MSYEPQAQKAFLFGVLLRHLRAGLGILLFFMAPGPALEAFDVQSHVSSPSDFTIEHASDTNTYYQVWVSESLSSIWSLVREMYLGENGVQAWTDAGALNDSPHLYYRLRRVLREHPDDYDTDGMDDVYELERSFLDPLDAADAQDDQDGDTLVNVDEYQNGTDPDNEDSDGDAIRDDVDPRPTNANEAPNMQSVTLSSAHNFFDIGPVTIEVFATDADGDSMDYESSVDGGTWDLMSGVQRQLQPQDLQVGYLMVNVRATDVWGSVGAPHGATGYVFRTPPTP